MATGDSSLVTAEIVWLFSAAGSLLTAKYLLEHKLHFPMHLLLLQLVFAVAWRAIRWLANPKELPLNAPLQRRLSGCRRSCRRYLQSFCMSATLICGYQAIHHFHNLPIVVMILSLDPSLMLDWPPRQKCSWNRFGPQIFWCLGFMLIFVFDFRPSVTGMTMSFSAFIFAALAGGIDGQDQEPLGMEQDHLCAPEIPCRPTCGLDCIDLMVAILSTLFWCQFREQQFSEVRPWNPLTADFHIIVLNLACTSSCLVQCGHLASIWKERQRYLPNEQHRSLLFSAALVSLVTVGCCLVSLSPPRISAWQMIGFSLTSLASSMGNFSSSEGEIAACTRTDSSLLNKPVESSLPNSSISPWEARANLCKAKALDVRNHYSMPLILLMTACVVLLTGIITASSFSQESGRGILDKSFTPTRQFDIVVAQYDESPVELATHINELLTLPELLSLDPHIIVYSKGSASNTLEFLAELQEQISARPSLDLTVESLQNIGRETDTYLEHITRYWDNLARHTLFMQAHVHHAPRAYLRRIRDYFVPNTGFLSLAETNGYCPECEDCNDRDWTEDPSVLRSIFQDFNREAECGDLVLTYRGQFIASAARIRGSSREAYERWLRDLREPQSFLHSAPYIESSWSRKEDFMSAPRVGFTFERMWGAMMQCNSRRIANRCPSLLSSLVCPPAICGAISVEDCQCLDG